MDKGEKELLYHLYEALDLIEVLRDGGNESEDYITLCKVIVNLEDYLGGQQSIL